LDIEIEGFDAYVHNLDSVMLSKRISLWDLSFLSEWFSDLEDFPQDFSNITKALKMSEQCLENSKKLQNALGILGNSEIKKS
jgi:hypothetical protein